MNIQSEFKRDLRNRRFEVTDEGGLFLPKSKIVLGGAFTHEHRRHHGVEEALRSGDPILVQRAQKQAGLLSHRADVRVGEVITDHNLLVDEGLNHILNVTFNGAVQVGTWYVGIFKGNYTPLASDTAANITGNSTEATEYDEANRVTYNEAASTAQSLTNSANRATFTINASITVYGAFLVSDNTKSGTSGSLASAARFSTSRSLVATDELLTTYTINASDAS